MADLAEYRALFMPHADIDWAAKLAEALGMDPEDLPPQNAHDDFFAVGEEIVDTPKDEVSDECYDSSNCAVR